MAIYFNGELQTPMPAHYAGSKVTYDNTSSGLTATNMQDAVDELNADITTVTDELLEVGSDKIRFKRKGNKVSFYGALSNLGSATQVDFGTLPSSHRPISGYQIFACYHPSLPHEATGSIWISDAGVVTIYKPASPTGLYVSGNYVSN